VATLYGGAAGDGAKSYESWPSRPRLNFREE
jgi:hypothetical protein